MKPAAFLALVPTGGLLTACTLLGSQGPGTDLPTQVGQHRDTTRISQTGFGSAARFAHCIDPACPRTTAKVLATTSSTKADVVVVPKSTRVTGTEPVAATETAQTHVPASERDVPQRTLVLHFAAGSAELTDAHRSALGKALDGLSRSDRIVILGRTDSLGSESLNQSLALARGLAVRHHLLDLVPDLPARISIDARGRCCYSASNDTSRGRAINRRVELVYVPRAGVAL